jgi:hypothetical protein
MGPQARSGIAAKAAACLKLAGFRLAWANMIRYMCRVVFKNEYMGYGMGVSRNAF